MNEQTSKLIEQLSQKLGTTTEYLWSVLIKQAFISAISSTLYLILMIIAGIILYRVHKYLGTEIDGNNSIYYDKEDVVAAPMLIAAIFWLGFFIKSLLSIDNVINGFFNPEYWALKEILDACK